MSNLRTAQNVAESVQSSYLGVYIETALKVRFGCNAPMTAEAAFSEPKESSPCFLHA